jgi:hypothetical protein
MKTNKDVIIAGVNNDTIKFTWLSTKVRYLYVPLYCITVITM